MMAMKEVQIVPTETVIEEEIEIVTGIVGVAQEIVDIAVVAVNMPGQIIIIIIMEEIDHHLIEAAQVRVVDALNIANPAAETLLDIVEVAEEEEEVAVL